MEIMRNTKTLVSLLLVLTMISVAATGYASGAADTSQEQKLELSERTVTVTDMSGDTVTITGKVKRIINLWPAGTSSFFVMGAGDLIAGLAVKSPATMNTWTQLFYPDCFNIPALGGITPLLKTS